METFQCIITCLNKACQNPILYELLDRLAKYDDTTWQHSIHVAAYCVQVGHRLSYSKDQLLELTIGGLLHDIGKLTIPLSILKKPDALTDEEYKLIQHHPQASYEILSQTGFPERICQMVLFHHRNFDGTGYPNLMAPMKDLDTMIQIIHLCDTYEALRTERPYKQHLPHRIVMDLLTPYANQRYDPALLDILSNLT